MKTLANLTIFTTVFLLIVSSQAADEADVERHRKAAEQGSVFDQTVLGGYYESGNGVKTNAVEAVKWYQKAAGQNYPVAQVLLGFCYHNGTGVATNDVEAIKWFRKAAEQGHPTGQYMLGHFYRYGTTVSTNYVEAVKWFNLAADQDYALAKQSQSEVVQRLTQKESAEARRLAREFKPQKP